MNLATITSILRHWITAGLGAFGLWLVAALVLNADDAKQLTEGLSKLVDPLVAVLGLIAVATARLAIKALGKFLGWGAGEIGDQTSGIPVWLMIGTAAVIGGSLPSCSADQLAAARGIPIKGCVITDQGTVCYSSKGGLSYEVDTRSGK